MDFFFHKHHFDNFDLLADSALEWNLDFSQIDKGETSCDIFQAIDESGFFGYFISNRALKQAGAPPENMWTFTLSSPTSTPWEWDGHTISNDTIIVYRPGSDFQCVSKPGFEVYTISTTPEILCQFCEELEMPELVRLLCSRKIVQCSPGKTLGLWLQATRQSQMLGQQLKGHQGLKLWRDLEQLLVKNIIIALAEGTSVYNSRKQEKARRLFEGVDQYLEANQFSPASVSELCQATRQSERTIQHNFRSLFGVTPKTYLKFLSLNHVRRELLESVSCISDVANKWGFWHMGQFAADYRQCFGELPSETNKRKIISGLQESWWM